MKEQLQKRLEELKSEYESGQNMLGDLEKQTADLQQTMLRITGAIQVLEEELAKIDQNTAEDEPEITESEESQ